VIGGLLLFGLWLALAIWWLRRRSFSREHSHIALRLNALLALSVVVSVGSIYLRYSPAPDDDRVYNFWWVTVLLYSCFSVCVLVTLAALIKNLLLTRFHESDRAI
jgi:hypothetical protein